MGRQGAAADPPPPSPAPVWQDWVPGVTYLPDNRWDARIPPAVLQRLRPKPTATDAAAARSSKVRAGRITDPAHPACGELGLFAARRLPSGEHLCDYRGVVTLAEHEDTSSAYTVAFIEEGELRLTLDAARAGSEGRFANDYHGVPVRAPLGRQAPKARANACFKTYVDARGNTRLGIFAEAALGKGDEVLLSYGRGFWRARTSHGAEETIS